MDQNMQVIDKKHLIRSKQGLIGTLDKKPK